MPTHSRLAEALVAAAMFVELWLKKNLKTAIHAWRLYRQEKK